MSRRQVITLQAGGFANYVGAHFWNAQDEAAGLAGGDCGEAYAAVDSAVLYREGCSAQGGSSFTPRLVLFDLAGAMGGVAAQPGAAAGVLGSAGSTASLVVATWDGSARLVHHPPVAKSHFYRALEEEAEEVSCGEEEEAAAKAAEPELELEPGSKPPTAAPAVEAPLELEAAAAALEGCVRYWSDFLKAPLHARTPQLLHTSWGDAAQMDGFGDTRAFTEGVAAEEAHERIRFFAEECDTLAGFHVLAQDGGAFGSLTEALLTHLADDYSRAPVLLYATRAPHARVEGDHAAARRRALSEAMAAARCAPLASVYAPLGLRAPGAALPGLSLDDAQAFHASAPLAVAIDAATLPWRLSHTPSDHGCGAVELSEALRCLNGGVAGRPFAATALALPAARLLRPPPRQGSSATPPLQLAQLVSLTEGVPSPCEAFLFEALAIRGLRFTDGAHADLQTVQLATHMALRTARTRCLRSVCAAVAPLPVPLSFPRILHARPPRGAADAPRPCNPEEVAVMARTCATEDFTEGLRRTADTFRVQAASAPGRAVLAAWGVDAEEAGDVLCTLAAAYKEVDGDSDDS